MPADANVAGLRITVLGAGGFIASHLLPYLASRGARLVSVVRTPPAADVGGMGDIVLADLTTSPRSWVEGRADVVVDLATLGSSIRGAEQIDAELAITTNALEAAAALGATHFVFLGSADEYGAAPAPQREDSERLPLNWYGRAKLACSDLVLEAAARHGITATVLRPFSVYGERQPRRMFVAGAVHSAVAGSPFRMSLGTQVRDFVYVADVARAIGAAVTRREPGTFNLGTGVGTRLLDVVDRLRSRFPGFEVVRGDTVAPTDPPALIADTEAAAAQLGWRAETSLTEGLARVIEYEVATQG